MRGIEELDHYEMLEVPRGASPGEIDRAYRLAQQTYAEGSLALYSIFEKRDAAEIRARLDEAYRVLADPELRSSYDVEHRAEPAPNGQPVNGAASAHRATNGAANTAANIAANTAANGAANGATNGAAVRAPIAAPSSPRMNAAVQAAVQASAQNALHASVHPSVAAAARAFDEAVEGYDGREDDAGTGEFDGPRLRRTRLYRGFEIDQIADVTKVAGSHLRNIEDENYADLPADVYVRGFVTAYAKTIGLDPQAVVPSYMARLQESRQKSQKSRFLGLR